jgi:hypothetical protein
MGGEQYTQRIGPKMHAHALHITTSPPSSQTPPQTHYAAQPQSHLTPTGTKNTRCLALHDVGRTAKGDAFAEEDSHKRKAVVDGIVTENVLHRVLYPQVHVNGVKKKKKSRFLLTFSFFSGPLSSR